MWENICYYFPWSITHGASLPIYKWIIFMCLLRNSAWVNDLQPSWTVWCVFSYNQHKYIIFHISYICKLFESYWHILWLLLCVKTISSKITSAYHHEGFQFQIFIHSFFSDKISNINILRYIIVIRRPVESVFEGLFTTW